jgi:hypothetical protein
VGLTALVCRWSGAGWQRSSWPGRICLFYLNTILRTEREQAEFERILQAYPNYQRLTEDGTVVDVYLLEVS